MSMSELHKPEWYGECAIISDKYNDYTKFYIRFLIIRMNTILSNIFKYRKTLILPRIYHD